MAGSAVRVIEGGEELLGLRFEVDVQAVRQGRQPGDRLGLESRVGRLMSRQDAQPPQGLLRGLDVQPHRRGGLSLLPAAFGQPPAGERVRGVDDLRGQALAPSSRPS